MTDTKSPLLLAAEARRFISHVTREHAAPAVVSAQAQTKGWRRAVSIYR